MKNLSMGLLGVLLLALAGCTDEPFSASFVIGTGSIVAGGSGTVQILVVNPPDVKTFQVGPTGVFTFDPTVAHVTSVTGVNGFQVFASSIDNGTGQVKFSAGFPGGSIRPILNTGISLTELPIIAVHFTAVGAPGANTVLSITNVDVLADRNGKDIVVTSIKSGELDVR